MNDFPNFKASLDQSEVSYGSIHAALYSWVRLLPESQVVPSNPHSRDFILQLVEKIVKSPTFWGDNQLLPRHLFEILLRVIFPPATSSATEEDTTRLLKIYTSLKEVALACALRHEQHTRSMFTLSLRLAGEGNPDLAKEAIEIAIWCMEKVDCGEDWYKMCKENIEASVALRKALVDVWPDLSLKLPSSSSKKQFIQMMFTVSLRLVGEGNHVLAKEAAEIATWSLTENVDCWKHWVSLRSKENLEASVDLVRMVVLKWNERSLLELPSPSTKAMKQFIRKMVYFSLEIAGESIAAILESSSVVPGKPVLLGQASAVAIWSLTELVDCCKQWDNLYMEILKKSGDLLENLLDKCEDHSIRLESSSSLPPRILGGGVPEGQELKLVYQQIFTFSLRLAGKENPFIAEEAIFTSFCSLTDNFDCCTHWVILYKENIEASVALLKELVEEWPDVYLDLSSSPGDILTLSETIKSFRRENKKAIAQGGANGYLFKEADKLCKVISWRLSLVSCSLNGASCIITAAVVLLVVALVYLLFYCVWFL